MPATSKTSTRRRSTSAATTRAADTATPDTAIPDAAIPDTAIPDTAIPDTAIPDTSAHTDAVATGARTDDQTGATVDGATTVDGGTADGAVAGADGATWADAVPWLALQVGSRPTALEVALAVPVWNMLHQSPGTTALRLAADAEARGVALDPAVVSRVLERFVRAGIVTASEDAAFKRWSPVTPGQLIVDTQQAMATSATACAAGGSRSVRATVGGATALPPGGLRAAVAAYLAEHPYQDWSASQIGNVLGNSSGAIAKSLERLVGDRVAVRTSDRPCRYQHAGTPDGAEAEPTGDTTDTGSDTDRADTDRPDTDTGGEGADGQ